MYIKKKELRLAAAGRDSTDTKKSEREREKNRGKLGCFVEFSTFKTTRLSANFGLIFERFWCLIGGSLGAEASDSNYRVLSLVHFGRSKSRLRLQQK